jgi:hypothetical protein
MSLLVVAFLLQLMHGVLETIQDTPQLRVWRNALNTHVFAAAIKPKALVLDMPVRWNSTYKMLEAALALQTPIIAVCATQTLDISMPDVCLTGPDWLQLAELQEFLIFFRPSEKMQGSAFPTLNYVIPQYILMLQKLKKMLQHFGEHTAIGQACSVAIKKLDEYYTLATSQRESHSTIATICDPRYLMNVFKITGLGLMNSVIDEHKSSGKSVFIDILNGNPRLEQLLLKQLMSRQLAKKNQTRKMSYMILQTLVVLRQNGHGG